MSAKIWFITGTSRGFGREWTIAALEPPLRVFFGELPLELAKADYQKRLATWEQWQPIAVVAQG